MADPTEDDIPDNTTWGAHMRAIRADLKDIREHQIRVVELLGRVSNQLLEFRSTTTNQMTQIQSDLILLEGHNMSRHGEIRNILERLDRANIPKNNILGMAEATAAVGVDVTTYDPNKGFTNLGALKPGDWNKPKR